MVEASLSLTKPVTNDETTHKRKSMTEARRPPLHQTACPGWRRLKMQAGCDQRDVRLFLGFFSEASEPDAPGSWARGPRACCHSVSRCVTLQELESERQRTRDVEAAAKEELAAERRKLEDSQKAVAQVHEPPPPLCIQRHRRWVDRTMQSSHAERDQMALPATDGVRMPNQNQPPGVKLLSCGRQPSVVIGCRSCCFLYPVAAICGC